MDEAEARLRGVVENLQRADLLPLEEAEGLRALIAETGLTQEEVAQRIGKSQSAVANKLRLLKLSEGARRVAGDHPGVLTERHLRALLPVQDGEAQARLARRAVDEGWTVKETEERVERLLAARRPKGTRRGVVRDVRIVLNTFRRAVATLVEGGLPAEMTEEDGPDVLTVTVRIPKRRQREGA